LNISREGDSTTSLGSLFQCSVTLRVKKFFLSCKSYKIEKLVIYLFKAEADGRQLKEHRTSGSVA